MVSVRQLALVLAASLAACSQELPTLDLRVIRGEVDLARQVPGDWDRVCLLTPYTSTGVAAEKTGLSMMEVAGLGLENSDHLHILFFMRGEQVFAAYQVPRQQVDFDYTQPTCLDKSDATLKAHS